MSYQNTFSMILGLDSRKALLLVSKYFMLIFFSWQFGACLLRQGTHRTDTGLYDFFYYLVAISMYVCEGGNSGSFSCKSSPRVKSVPDGPKARKGERQQKAEEIQQGICCAN